MKLEDVKIGMLVNRVHNNELFGDNPRTVVGFDGVKVVTTVADGQTISLYANNFEPAHDGCGGCKHNHLKCDEIQCHYCRYNKHHSGPLYNKLPDLWEPFEEENEANNTFPISKDDSRYAAEIIIRYADVVTACNSDIDTTDLQELAKRIRNGVCK